MYPGANCPSRGWSRPANPHPCQQSPLLVHPYLTESVYKVALQKSIPPQIRQLILRYCQYREQVDGCVRELTLEANCPSRGWSRPESPHPPSQRLLLVHHYLTESDHKVVLQKSIPVQIRQLGLYISHNKG